MYRRRRYSRRRYSRRRSYKRRRYGSKGEANAVGMARSAYRLARHVKGLLNTEFKFKDNSGSVTPSTGTPSLIFLNNVARGDDSSTRDGYSFRMKSLSLNYSCKLNSSATSTMVRIIVFMKWTSDGSALTANDVLENSSYVQSHRNLNNTKNIKVLHDKIIELDTANRHIVQSSVI